MAAAHGITRGELFPFGPSARDQILAAGNDQTHQLELEQPVLFYDGTFDSIFVSVNPHRLDTGLVVLNQDARCLLVRVDYPSGLRNCACPGDPWVVVRDKRAA